MEQNIIKYKDQTEINSYLDGNRHQGKANLDIQYRQLSQLNRQEEQVCKRLKEEDDKVNKLVN